MWTRLFFDKPPQKRRRVDPFSNERKDAYFLPPEMWIEILKNIEPIFMYQLFLVSKDFTDLAKQALLVSPIDYILETPSFECWHQHYIEEVSTLSYQAKKLFDFATYHDYEQIERMELNPLTLFEKTYGEHVVMYINHENNQHLRDSIFHAAYRWFRSNIRKDLSTIEAILSYALPINERASVNFYKLMNLAVALNQVAFVDKHKEALYTLLDNHTKLSHLDLACKFGFEKLIHIMLEKNNFLYLSLSESNSLILAIQNNHEGSVKALLSKVHECNAIPLQDALFYAVHDTTLPFLRLLLPLVESFDDPNFPHELLALAQDRNQPFAEKLIAETFNLSTYAPRL